MREDLTFRCAEPAERSSLEALQWRASLVWPEYREALLAHPDAIDLPAAQLTAGQVMVCERDGLVVGFAVVLPRDDGDLELDGLFVEPAAWRTGVGTQLIAEAETRGSRAGAHSLRVVANPKAVPFYQACGFKADGRQQTRFGPATLMHKPLG